MDAHQEAQVLLVVGDREPVFDQDDAGAHQHAFEIRHGAEEILAFLIGAEAHNALDAGAVIPAAIEQHDLASGRQVRHVALKVPLRALAFGRGRKRHDLADAGIEPLGHPLDHAALAGGVAALEQHEELKFVVGDPILELDQFLLQPQQFLEVDVAVERLGLGAARLDQLGEPFVVDLKLEFLVHGIDQLVVEALFQGTGVFRFRGGRFVVHVLKSLCFDTCSWKAVAGYLSLAACLEAACLKVAARCWLAGWLCLYPAPPVQARLAGRRAPISGVASCGRVSAGWPRLPTPSVYVDPRPPALRPDRSSDPARR